MMSPDEVKQLAAAGDRLLMHMTADGLVGSILWAIHSMMSVAAMVSILRCGLSTRGSKILFTLLLVILLASTVSMSITWAQLVQAVKFGFMANSHLPFEQRWEIVRHMNERLAIPWNWLNAPGGIMYLIGDMAATWRLWVICGAYRILRLVPLFLVISAFALSLTSNALFQFDISGKLNTISSPYGITGNASLACSLAANIITTALIAFEARRYRQFSKQVPPGLSSWMVMAYLAEMGAFYCVVQGIFVALNSTRANGRDPSLNYAFYFWQTFTLYISIMSPSFIVLLVSYNKSMVDPRRRHEHTNATGTHISFVHPSTTTAPSRTLDSCLACDELDETRTKSLHLEDDVDERKAEMV